MSEIPTRLGVALADRYLIKHELGAGGMATPADRRTGGPADGGSDG